MERPGDLRAQARLLLELPRWRLDFPSLSAARCYRDLRGGIIFGPEAPVAYRLELPDSRHQVKVRNPVVVALLSIVTLGIYHVVWWYEVNRELRDYGRVRGRDLGQSPALSTVAVFPGVFIIIPAIVTAWRGTKRAQDAARVSGLEPLNGWLALVLYILIGVLWAAYLQSELNNVWRAEGVPLPGEARPPALDDGMPPRLPTKPEDAVSPTDPGDPERVRPSDR